MKDKKECIIVGIDEAGRGPLAGPVAVAAVATTISNFQFSIFNKFSKLNFQFLKGIKDSKKLSEKKREDWFEIIKNNFSYSVAMVGPKVIDKIGIQKATKLALNHALRKLHLHRHPMSTQNCLVLLDGGLKAPKHYNQKTVIKGDEKISIISAASIMAKVKRDRKMKKLHKIYPEYCFDCHKGYGTKKHYEAIKKNGILDVHRKCYLQEYF